MMHIQCLVCRESLTLTKEDLKRISACPQCNHPFSLEQIDALVPSSAQIPKPELSPWRNPAPETDPQDHWSSTETTCFVGLPYRPESGIDWVRFPIFLIQMLLAGMVLGWLLSCLGEIIYLVFIFPLILGLILAGLGFVGNCWARIRHPLLAGFVGMASGSMALVTMHYVDYSRTMIQASSHPTVLPAPVTERLLEDPTVRGYLQATAREGMTVTARESSGINLGQAGTWAYWGLEAFIVLALGYFGCRASAWDPFCARCHRWKMETSPGLLQGSEEEIVQVLTEGRIGDLIYFSPSKTSGSIRVWISACSTCKEHGRIEIRLEHAARRTDEPILHITCPGGALPVIAALFSESGSSEESLQSAA